MLVLTRKIGQKLMIGDDIVVSIVDVRGERVRLGIKADPDVAVDRAEVRRRMEAAAQEQNTSAPTERRQSSFITEPV